MPPPVVFRHIPKCGVNSTLRSYRVGPGWELKCIGVYKLPKFRCTNVECHLTSFDMHAVSNPLSAKPTAAIRPAPPAPTTMALVQRSAGLSVETRGEDGYTYSYLWSMIPRPKLSIPAAREVFVAACRARLEVMLLLPTSWAGPPRVGAPWTGVA
jgi:hypothetical protein